jgi:hypothetical protein
LRGSWKKEFETVSPLKAGGTYILLYQTDPPRQYVETQDNGGLSGVSFEPAAPEPATITLLTHDKEWR